MLQEQVSHPTCLPSGVIVDVFAYDVMEPALHSYGTGEDFSLSDALTLS